MSKKNHRIKVVSFEFQKSNYYYGVQTLYWPDTTQFTSAQNSSPVVASNKIVSRELVSPVNIPVPAKETLLARLTKRGIPIPTPEEQSCPNFGNRKHVQNIRAERKFLPPAAERITNPKKRDSLTGKLLSAEIEFFPSHPLEFGKRSPVLTIASDGSIPNGQEWKKITWQNNIGRLAGILKLDLNGEVTQQCGLHVHVDARHLGENGLLSAGKTYDRMVLFYPHLKRLVPEHRLRNSYCKFVNNRNTCHRGRYAALNWQAFEEHGTIEFRLQAGSTNNKFIESWLLVCQRILNYCAIPENNPDLTWTQFLEIFSEPLRSWCKLRFESLYRDVIQFNSRSLSAIGDCDDESNDE